MNDSSEHLGRFLRERRARVTLEQAGIPTRRTRRGATLTQEDLARITGYSIRTISALEQGAEHRPTPELLEALSDALWLSHDERTILWHLAGGSAPPEPDSVPEVGPDPALQRMLDALDPNPAYVTDEHWRYLGQNTAFARGICDFTTFPANERTILHWLFLHEHARHASVEWEQEAAALIALVRGRALRSPRGGELLELVGEICDRSEEAQRLWANRTDLIVQGPSRPMLFREPGHTNPAQPDEQAHHIELTVITLTPVRTGDGRRVVAFLLPEDYTSPSSDARCTACPR